MPEYAGTPDFTHGTPPRLGVLLVNLGTPEAPTARAVRRYLAEFLSDPRVVEAPRALWWLALHGVILRIRPRRSAEAYAKIWTPQGSPLLVHSQALEQGLQRRLAARFGDRVLVALAMSYGLPAIGSTLEQLRHQNVRRLLVLPLYPQYSGSTTASIIERVTGEVARWRWIPELRFVNDYHDDEPYVAAVADSVAEHWRVHGRKHLLFSFHSIPQRFFLAGDPYHCQCQATARLVAARLGLAAEDWSVGFQSRFGREPWLQPYTDLLLEKYAQSGPAELTVVCPGFAVDCLETLEEVDIRYRAAFYVRGGEALDYVPCLNSSEGHVTLLEHLLLRHAAGWPEIEGRVDPHALASARDRAIATGAPR
jgi:ferrochelatase